MISYLGSPYSHPSPAVRRLRFEHAVIAARHLMRQGKTIFCPIAHSHDIGLILPESENTLDFWLRQDLPILRQCGELIVLRLDGWQESKGVAAEMREAEARNTPVSFLDYDPAWTL